MSRHLIGAVDPSHERYPFDDAFSTLPIVNHCLEDRFSDFLDFEKFLPGINDQSWAPERFRTLYGSREVYAHHDMRLPENREKFRRRVNRFMALDADTLFVVVGDTPAVFYPELQRLRANVTRLFGDAGILAIGLGPEPGWYADGVHAFHLAPRSSHDGLMFSDPADHDALVGAIRSVASSGQR